MRVRLSELHCVAQVLLSVLHDLFLQLLVIGLKVEILLICGIVASIEGLCISMQASDSVFVLGDLLAV